MNTKNNEFNSVVIFPIWNESPRLGRSLPGQRARHTSTVGNVNIALSEKVVLLLHAHVDFPVWLLRRLSLDGKLCLRDDNDAAFV